MKRNNLKGSLILITAALIWGLAFVAQSKATAVPSFLLNSLRSLISAVFLFFLLKIMNRKTKEPILPTDPAARKSVLRGALICGVLLTVSANFQQFGIAAYPDGVATEAHAGFITALYVVIVPLLSVFLKKKVPPTVWIAVLIAVIGFYLLCLSGGLDGIYLGDLLVLLCAFSFSFHILSVDHFVERVGGVRLSMLQFLVTGILSGLLSLIFEADQTVWREVIRCALPILYLGIMSSGVAYTLQIIGQRYAEPAIASLSMSLESVFAALGGWLLLGNTLHPAEFAGCALVFAGIIVAQFPELIGRRSAQCH